MSARESLTPDRSLWHLIAVQLRRYREDHGLSGTALADLLECDRSTVSRYESAMIHLPERHAKIVDRLWETDGLFTYLVRFATATNDSDYLVGLAEYEARATRVRMWEASIMPGLVQTPEYARAALAVGLAEDAAAALETRLARQLAVFERPKPPYVSVLLHWAALEQPVGDPEIMRGQLAHLLDLGDRSHVSVRVVSKDAGAHVGLDGAFKIMTVDGVDVAYAEDAHDGRLIRDPIAVERFSIRYDLIGDIAMPVPTSRALIAKALESYG
ncbi:helix-turn-helix domain-containing protein [Actinomadura nitritigenes]|uniref:helix-turn-helix domain-containing protein n=1 Tax=Actinomadura nitritigenes TaxID=134602 RepID=UPI003D8E50F7